MKKVIPGGSKTVAMTMTYTEPNLNPNLDPILNPKLYLKNNNGNNNSYANRGLRLYLISDCVMGVDDVVDLPLLS
jgi:hypothetical protein